MRWFALVFMGIMLFAIIKGYRASQADLEKLAKELGIDKEHPMNETLWNYVFFNRFRYWMLLFVIFYTGVMLYVTLSFF